MEFTTPIYKTKAKPHRACPALQKLLIVPEGFKKPALVSSVLGPCPSGNLVLTQLICFSRMCTEGSTQAGQSVGLGQVSVCVQQPHLPCTKVSQVCLFSLCIWW